MKDTILVTGAGGVLGAGLLRRLDATGQPYVAIHSRADCDLENPESAQAFFAAHRPSRVYHLAGAVFGVGGNLAYPADIFRRNTLINCNVVEACRLAGTTKIVAMGTVSMYADGLAMPLRESDVLQGEPHGSERYYGFAKRGLLMQLESYREQYGLDYALAVSTNLYGPGDRFDELHGHVIPSLIRKFVASERTGEPVSVWGDGTPTRDFLYADDAGDALIALMGGGTGTFNVATGESVTIKQMVETLAELVPEARYVWDADKPLGQLRRAYDVTRLRSLGFEPRTSLREGLATTVRWYRDNLASARR